MNVRCPACSRLYRIADARVAGGAILRCTGCGHQFKGGGPSKDPIAMDVVQPADRRRPSAAPLRPVSPPPGSDRFAIIADAGRPFRNILKPVLQEFGFRIEVLEQGTEAFRLAVAR